MSLVCGLLRHRIRAGGFCETEGTLEEYKIRTDSKMLIDGNSFAWRLFEIRARDGQENDIEEYERRIREFFVLNPCIKSFVIKDKANRPVGIFNRCSEDHQTSLVPPWLPVECIRTIARDFNYDVYDCSGEIHERMADLSRELECPILTDDGYFLRRPSPHGLIHWDSITLDSSDCKLLRLEHAHKSCQELDRKKLGLINALIIERAPVPEDKFRVAMMLRNRLTPIVSPSECKPSASGRRLNERILAGIWSHLCYKNYEAARRYIVGLVEKRDQPTVKSLISEGAFDLDFDQSTGELRAAIEELCECPSHRRIRVVSWLEFLYDLLIRPSNVLKFGMLQVRAKTDLISTQTRGSKQLMEDDCRAALLECLGCSVEHFYQHLDWHQLYPDSDIVREFVMVKLLLYALDKRNPRLKLSEEFKLATLSCLLYYLGEDGDFLDEYRQQLIAAVTFSGHKLRTPLKSVSASNPRILQQIRTLVQVISTFNGLNSRNGYPLQVVWPTDWLNPCFIYNLTEDPEIMGTQIPTELSSPLRLN